MRCVLLLASIAPLWSASIAGQPQPPTPAPMPGVWASFQDDLIGDAVLNTDDYRTGGLRLNGRGDLVEDVGVVMAVDYSALTDRGLNTLPPGRCDELTASVGLAWDGLDRGGGRVRPLLVVAGGGRLAGNLGGQSAQNDIHRTCGFNPVFLPYGHDQAFAFQGNVYGRVVADVLHIGVGSLGLAVDGGTLMSSAHERQSFTGLRAVSMGGHGIAWVGGRHQWHNGDTQSATAQAVAEHEQGWWIDWGLGLGPIREQAGGGDRASWGVWLDGAVNPGTKAIDGSVGLVWGVTSAARKDTVRTVVEPVFFTQTNGGAIGIRLGLPLRCGGDWYLTPVLDYHHGAVSGHDWPGNELDANQMTLGLEPSYRHRFAGTRLVAGAYAHVDGGVRVEGIAEKTQPARFAHASATRGVVTGGAGIILACLCADAPRADAGATEVGTVSLRLGYDGWLPWSGATVEDAAGVERYQQAGGSAVAGLGLSVAW